MPHPKYYMFMSEQSIRNNWTTIKRDRDLPGAYTDVDHFIKEVRLGNVHCLGAQLTISDEMPPLSPRDRMLSKFDSDVWCEPN